MLNPKGVEMHPNLKNGGRKSPKKQTSPTADPVDWARRYIGYGFALCRVAYASKAAFGRNWQRTPVEDPNDFEGFGIGLNHAHSRTVALDVDAVVESQVWFEARGIDLKAILDDPKAVGISSGRPNRAKRIFRLPADEMPLKTTKIVEGGRTLFELRCDGAQDVLPPSIHEDTGRPYEWVGDWKKLTVLSPELLALWKELIHGHQSAKVGDEDSENDPFSMYRNPRQIAEAEAALAVIPWDGMTDDEWVKLMFAVIDAGIDGETFLQWGALSPEYDDEKFWTRWHSCYRNRFGQNGIRVTSASLFGMAKKADPKWQEKFKEQWRVEHPEDYQVAEGDDEAVEGFPGFQRMVPDSFFIEPPEFIVEDLIVRGEAGQIVGPGGIGKSTLCMLLCICIATGRSYLGHFEVQQNKVLYISGEDGQRGYVTRFRAIKRALDLTEHEQKDLDKNFRWLDLRDKEFRKYRRLMKPGDLRGEFEPGALAKILQSYAHGFGLVVLDPMSSITSGEENSNDAMKRLVEITRDVADDIDAGIEVVQHTGKGQKEYSQHSGRGGSAQADGSRSVKQLGIIKAKEFNYEGVVYLVPEELGATQEDLDMNRVLALGVMKMTWDERKPKPLFILRSGYSFKAEWGVRKPETGNMDSRTEKLDAASMKLLEALADSPNGLGVRQIRDLFRSGAEALKDKRKKGLGNEGVEAVIDSLMSAGLIFRDTKTARSPYRISPSGRDFLAEFGLSDDEE